MSPFFKWEICPGAEKYRFFRCTHPPLAAVCTGHAVRQYGPTLFVCETTLCVAQHTSTHCPLLTIPQHRYNSSAKAFAK